jgi:RHS repeat-associated protein
VPNEDPDGDGVKVTVNLRFPGQYYDAETGLHYNWNRYYDPKTGRYVTSDPVGLRGGFNSYLYAKANPLFWTDRRGLVADTWEGPGTDIGTPPYLWLYPPGSNGNVWNTGFEQQDMVCSSIAAPLNSNRCTRQCCEEHDRCYTRYGCNQTSWAGNAIGVSFPCQQCNAAAVQCVRRNFGRKDCDNGCQSK